MKEEIKNVLNTLENNGFEAYVVGGFVRDYLLCHESNDIDICTNAKPKEIQDIFGNSNANGNYGTFTMKTKEYNYDITTYRKEFSYKDRRPDKMVYTDNLLEDLKRRDFTINAICMNKEGKILDFENGVEDLENKIIRTIGNPEKRILEDPLRMIRAIRFSCTLNFQIDKNLRAAMTKYQDKLKTLSNSRLKEEIDKILLSENFEVGFALLKKLHVLETLKISYKDMVYVSDLCGMWAQMEVETELPFIKMEKNRITKIKELLKQFSLSKNNIFSYGLDYMMICAKIKRIPEKEVLEIYEKMPIKSQNDLDITFQELQRITKKTPKEVNNLIMEFIDQILNGSLENKKESMIKYYQEKAVKE